MSEFKENFVWGAATAACQIEGRKANDGKGLDIWDVYCSEDGKIYNGQNIEQACMHVKYYKEDIAFMKELVKIISRWHRHKKCSRICVL